MEIFRCSLGPDKVVVAPKMLCFFDIVFHFIFFFGIKLLAELLPCGMALQFQTRSVVSQNKEKNWRSHDEGGSCCCPRNTLSPLYSLPFDLMLE